MLSLLASQGVFIVGYVMHRLLRSDGQGVSVSCVEKSLVAILLSIRSYGEGNCTICRCYSAFYPLLAVESKAL